MTEPNPPRRSGRMISRLLLLLAAVYLLLLIPDSSPPPPKGAGKQAFLWNRDGFWSALENQFREARALTPAERLKRFDLSLKQLHFALDAVTDTNSPPTAPAFEVLEDKLFQLAPIAAACPERLPDFMRASARLRHVVKWQSQRWPMDSAEARQRIYRLLYGRRAAVEETTLQAPAATNTLEVIPTYDFSYHQKWDDDRSFKRFLAVDPMWFDDQGVIHAKTSRDTDEPAP